MAQPSRELNETRRRLRALRLALDAAGRARAERAIARQLRALRLIRPGMALGAYCAVRGEVDLRWLIDDARRCGARIFLPRISSMRRSMMQFHAAPAAITLQFNRHGIPEPPAALPPVPTRALDVVLVPMLGFDTRGFRLGMGGGYYDRWLRRRRLLRHWRRPLLVGIAFASQRLEAIATAPWDVPMDLVITDAGCIRPARKR